jgi:predicted nucleic acid-binding protein
LGRFLPDTSCIIAALSPWHEHYDAALRALDGRLDDAEAMIVAAPTLVEAYSVMTRLPASRRSSPAAAHELLEDFVLQAEQVVALNPESYRGLLRSAPGRGVEGGTIYDAVIMACAEAARVDTLLTFNARHFERLSAPGIAIVVPR